VSEHQGDPTQELIEEYVLGLVGPDEAVAIEARIARDRIFAAAVRSARETLAAMALSSPVEPSAALKDRVLTRIAATSQTTPETERVLAFPTPHRSRSTAWLGFALAASLALVAKLSFDLRSARRAESEAAAVVAARDLAIAKRDSLLSVLTDPAMEMVTLAATGEKKPTLRAYIDHKRLRMTLSATSLEAMPTGRVYQLWFIMDGKPVPSVTFTAGTDGRAMLENVPMPAGAIAATAITVEPSGGSPLPTTQPIFVGKLAEK
jgi:anti-sigma-K factor RskA